MPEVSLVAILDADKEGFLRSEGSLIQTMGRAARNIHGKAILYADKMTGSMERAIKETNRRREKQVAHNLEHGITPKGVEKKIADVMEAAYGIHSGSASQYAKVAEEVLRYANMTPKQLEREIKSLEQQMYEHARNLEFEEAATIRNKIREIKEENLGFRGTRAV
jgi:excinuclease ABC subunit B